MKGVLLAGGLGTRLKPITNVTNKHLLPVFNKPMVEYPLQMLKDAGVTDIILITGPENAGDFMKLLGSGKDFGVKLTYRLQDEAGGIAQALGMAEDFVGKDKCMAVLGDNILGECFRDDIEKFEKCGAAKIFLKEVSDPERFGVALLKDNKITKIEEKPAKPKSNLIVIGVYLYGPEVFNVIKTLKPSARGELEITGVNNFFVEKGTMDYRVIEGFWSDAGTFPSLYRASRHMAEKILEDTGGKV
jgi:glucose-1-phosphate thymidylyltransferase